MNGTCCYQCFKSKCFFAGFFFDGLDMGEEEEEDDTTSWFRVDLAKFVR